MAMSEAVNKNYESILYLADESIVAKSERPGSLSIMKIIP
jgi:hypothetical protein